jgi:hypothetical protein
MVAVRRAPVFFETVYVNVPLPVPLAGIPAIQDAPPVAVHEQLAPVVTFTDPVPPAAAKLLLVGDRVQVQTVVALAVFEYAEFPPVL